MRNRAHVPERFGLACRLPFVSGMDSTITTLCRGCGQAVSPQRVSYSLQVLRYHARLEHESNDLQWAQSHLCPDAPSSIIGNLSLQDLLNRARASIWRRSIASRSRSRR